MIADGVVLIPENVEDIKEMLQDLSRRSAEVGLTPNYSKRKLMPNSSCEQTRLRGSISEYVD